MPAACPAIGQRISRKKRERRKTFEFRRQLNPRVGRRCAPDDRRRFRRPVARARSVRITPFRAFPIIS